MDKVKVFEATVLPITDMPNHLRWKRKWVFKVINRGNAWYRTLTEEQLVELDIWYKAWLDAPDTLVEPVQPSWL